MFEYYCSKCGKYHSEWRIIDCHSEYVDACLLEYEIAKCLICGEEYEVLINDEENDEE